MAIQRLLGSKTTRTFTVLAVLFEAKRAFDRGNQTRSLLLLGVAVLAWKWTIIGLAAQGVLKGLRAGRPVAPAG